MSTTNTLCFGDADPVTGIPKIDGLTDLDFLPYNMSTDPIESGYVNGSRLTFAGGTLASGGTLPRVVAQFVRQPPGPGAGPAVPDRLVLGFMVRFDTTFSNSDFIVIAVRSQFSDPNSPARMIVIKPNFSNLGADSGVTGGGNDIKTNKDGQSRSFYKSTGTNPPWAGITEDGVDIKVRSWRPTRVNATTPECAWSVEVSLPRTVAAAAAAAALAVPIGSQSDWIDLNDAFGLYFAISRVNNAGVTQATFPTTLTAPISLPGATFTVPLWGNGLVPALQTPVGINTGVGVRFLNDAFGVGRRDLGSIPGTATNSVIEGNLGSGNDNELVAMIENTATVDADDITAEFRFAYWGLGPGNITAWDRPAGLDPNPTPSRVNPPLDTAINLPAYGGTGPYPGAELISKWPRAAVGPEFQADPHRCIWVQLSSATGVNFTQSSVRRNMNFDQLSELSREAVISGVGYPAPPNGAAEHDFVLETFCRPIIVQELVDQGQIPNPEMEALVTGTLHDAALQGKDLGHGELFQDGDSGQEPSNVWRNSIIYAWFAFGYRRTGTFVTIDGKDYEYLDPAPGSFGISAYHEGVDDNFSYALSGPRGKLVQYQPGIYGVKVPHNGETRIGIKLGASRGGPEGDLSALPRAEWPSKESTVPIDQGCRRLIERYGVWGLILAVLILLFLYWLFG